MPQARYQKWTTDLHRGFELALEFLYTVHLNESRDLQPKEFVSSIVSDGMVNGRFGDPTRDGGQHEPTGLLEVCRL